MARIALHNGCYFQVYDERSCTYSARDALSPDINHKLIFEQMKYYSFNFKIYQTNHTNISTILFSFFFSSICINNFKIFISLIIPFAFDRHLYNIKYHIDTSR